MGRQRWLVVGLLVAACGVAFGQEGLVKQVEDALRTKDSDAVYDFGKLLTPGGAVELRQRAAQFRASGLNVYFVTVPKDSTNVDALAESVYRNLAMTANDILIVFDGKQVYGKTLALKGEPQAFQDAFKDAQPSFMLYHAKGLAHFALSLHDRIVQRRAIEAAEMETTAKRRRALWAIGLFVLLLGVGVVTYPRLKQRAIARKRYTEWLASAEQLFQQVAFKMPDNAPNDITANFLELDRDLEHCREREAATIADVNKLIDGLQILDSRLTER